MFRKAIAPFLIIITLVLSACNLPQATSTQAIPSQSPPSTAAVTDTALPSDTPIPTATATPIPSNTPAPSPTATNLPANTSAPTATATTITVPPTPAPSSYIDDRSTPSQVIVSLYNAINRREYLRAYNYWNNPGNTLGSFNAYANGYQSTASVDLVFGQITGDAGMSQVYYTVPVILKATANNGTRSNFAACYLVHKTQPDVFGAPPFAPMGIERGSAVASALNASDASALATACNGFPVGPMVVPIAGSNLSIDASNFLDNRSGPIETVSSFLNSLNLKQYVRAYSYFQAPATFPGAFNTWAAGYANTGTTTVSFGSVLSEGAAGSLYYKVPLAMHVLTTSNSQQTFVGCYTLRLSQPTVQATPPFRPMGIIAGKFTQVANNTDVNTLLPTACN